MAGKVILNKREVIVFVGSMNAMPMMYAWELKKLNYNVLYFVDAPASNVLSRPENHFREITYPYPDWIVEQTIPTQMLLPLCPSYFAKKLLKRVAEYSDEKICCFVLNGFFVSLARWLKTSGPIVALSHGSDLDVWANRENIPALAHTFGTRSIFKYIPTWISRRLIKRVVEIQFGGFNTADTVIYFPFGLNRAGDTVISLLKSQGAHVLERYDISFEPLRGVSREMKVRSTKTIIFSGVRFLYKTFPDGNSDYCKGNDLIIKGLAEYYVRNQNIEIHFVEKGEDVESAKRLCEELGLGNVVVWHKEMPFSRLIELYLKADICFDQVGAHWMGAIGAYALFLGRPLISNVRNAESLGIFPDDHPVLSASNAIEIFHALICLEDDATRREISLRGKAFVEKEMSCMKLIHNLFCLE